MLPVNRSIKHTDIDRFFRSRRILWPVAWWHDTKELYNLQTRGSSLCRHRVRYRPFEKLYARVDRRRWRNGNQSHSRRTAAGAGAPHTPAFVILRPRHVSLQDDRCDLHSLPKNNEGWTPSTEERPAKTETVWYQYKPPHGRDGGWLYWWLLVLKPC